MNTPTSPNFSDFSFRFCVDLSTINSAIVLTDKSTYILAGFEGIIFNIYAPSGLLIHQGDWTSPDIVNEGDSYTFSPLVFMGGVLMPGTYKVEAYIKDQNGVIYQWTEDGVTQKSVEVCLPNSLEGATGYFGGMNLKAEADCDNYRLCFFDYTAYVYKGTSGTVTGTSLKIIYPPDPNTFEQSPAQQYSIIPSCYSITVNGRYQFQAIRMVTYELGNDTCISFRYQFTNEDFIVACNANLCAVMCDFERLIKSMDTAQCNSDPNFAELSSKVVKITALMVQFENFKKCGKDVTGIIDEIVEIGDFDCDSCTPSAIVPNPIICNNGVFSLLTSCGITGNILQEGQNVQISVAGTNYSFIVDAASQTYLTTITTSDGCTSQTKFFLNLTSITDDLCKVKSSTDDACCDYLIDKLTSSDGSVIISETAPDGDGCTKVNLIAGANAVLYNDQPDVARTTTGQFDTYSIAANSAGVNGDQIIWDAYYEIAQTGDDTATLEFRINGVSFLSLGFLTTNYALRFHMELNRVSASTFRGVLTWNFAGAPSLGIYTMTADLKLTPAVSALDFTNIIILATQLTAIAGGATLTQKGFTVKLFRK